jgi:hypothetical protein
MAFERNPQDERVAIEVAESEATGRIRLDLLCALIGPGQDHARIHERLVPLVHHGTGEGARGRFEDDLELLAFSGS